MEDNNTNGLNKVVKQLKEIDRSLSAITILLLAIAVTQLGSCLRGSDTVRVHVDNISEAHP